MSFTGGDAGFSSVCVASSFCVVVVLVGLWVSDGAASTGSLPSELGHLPSLVSDGSLELSAFLSGVVSDDTDPGGVGSPGSVLPLMVSVSFLGNPACSSDLIPSTPAPLLSSSFASPVDILASFASSACAFFLAALAAFLAFAFSARFRLFIKSLVFK